MRSLANALLQNLQKEAHETHTIACVLRLLDAMEMSYASAIAFVALIGSFRTLHKAVRFASRGRQWSVSQK